jgi:thiol-disulfide isomerase/thioredoxin
MIKRCLVSFSVILCAAFAAPAQQPTAQQPSAQPPAQKPPAAQPPAQQEVKLKVGDPAPKLSVERWVKGQEVKSFEKRKVYVVEFWATWCGPCVRAIPHLTELQQKHRRDGLVIIGVAGSERGETEQDRVKVLEDFMRKEGDKMGYTVAFDADRSMSGDWMRPAGRNTIPTAFVVDKAGKIAYIGSPNQDLDSAIEQALKASGRAEAEPATVPMIALASFQPQVEQRQPAQQPEIRDLNPGDPAPALSLEEWVKGKPTSSLEKGNIYVVEFWATWCGPCIRAIPHLSELQDKHQRDNVRIIGVAASERGESDEARLEKLRGFVSERDADMRYDVAFDADRSMANAWLRAAGLNTIPNSFIVDKQGRIAWIGSPTALDEPLAQVIEGTWNTEAFAAEYRKERAARAMLTEQARLRTAVQRGEHDEALASIDRLSTLDERMKSALAGQKFELLLIHKKDHAAAYAFGGDAVRTFAKDDAEALNHIAWTIVDPDNADLKNKDLDLALRAATRADQLTRGESGAIVDTLAKVHFDRGEIAKALELQEKAVKVSVGQPYEAELKARLEQYRAAAKR